MYSVCMCVCVLCVNFINIIYSFSHHHFLSIHYIYYRVFISCGRNYISACAVFMWLRLCLETCRRV